jgi:hypothetical protein
MRCRRRIDVESTTREANSVRQADQVLLGRLTAVLSSAFGRAKCLGGANAAATSEVSKPFPTGRLIDCGNHMVHSRLECF